jgi:anti-sigma factor RsiW
MTSVEHSSHEVALQLLPWLVNGSLSDDEALATRDHASSCVICRRELASLELVQNEFALASEVLAAPAPDMREINRRLDNLIAQQNGWRDTLLRLRAFAQSPWRLAFVAQSIALLVLAVILLTPTPPQAEFTTLSNASVITGDGFVRVVFSPDLDNQTLTALLSEYDLSVIDGPTERGVYTLSSIVQLDEHAHGQMVLKLRGRSEVLFAQTVASDR